MARRLLDAPCACDGAAALEEAVRSADEVGENILSLVERPIPPRRLTGRGWDKGHRRVWGAVRDAEESAEVVMRLALILDPSFDLEAEEDGWTVLMRTCEWGMLKVAHVLVEAGADQTITDREGVTPLQHATSRGYTDIVTLLR